MRACTNAMRVAIFAVAALGSASAQGAPPQDQRPGVAVFPLYNGGSYGKEKEDFTALGLGLQQSLIHELAANSNLRVVDRSDLKKLLDEQNLAVTGAVDPATAAKVGKVVGARYVVLGSFIDLYGQFQLTGRIVDVQTSEVMRSAQVDGDRKKIFSLVSELGAQVTAGMRLPALPAAVRESRAKQAPPPEAMARHGAVLSFKDEGGDPARVVQMYKDLVKDFPMVDDYRSELNQLGG